MELAASPRLINFHFSQLQMKPNWGFITEQSFQRLLFHPQKSCVLFSSEKLLAMQQSFNSGKKQLRPSKTGFCFCAKRFSPKIFEERKRVDGSNRAVRHICVGQENVFFQKQENRRHGRHLRSPFINYKIDFTKISFPLSISFAIIFLLVLFFLRPAAFAQFR